MSFKAALKQSESEGGVKASNLLAKRIGLIK